MEVVTRRATSDIDADISEKARKLAVYVQAMNGSRLFEGLRAEECRRIAALARPRRFANNEPLYMQGHRTSFLALITGGCVKITQLSQQGSEAVLWVFGAGSPIGIHSIATSEFQPCSATAVERCTALIWDIQTVRSLMAEFPQLRGNVSGILFTRLNELEERFREVATERVEMRLARMIMRLSKEIGRRLPEGVEVALSRQEMAQMSGTTVFTVSRMLSRWAVNDIVRPHRERVLVRDPRRLEQLASIDPFEGRPAAAASGLR